MPSVNKFHAHHSPLCLQSADEAASDRESVGSFEPARKRLRVAASASDLDDGSGDGSGDGEEDDDDDACDVIPFGDSEYEPINGSAMSGDEETQPSDVEYENHRGLRVVNRFVGRVDSCEPRSHAALIFAVARLRSV